jgi:hypothetical protein
VVLASDGIRKDVATAVLGGKDIATADEALVESVFKGVVAAVPAQAQDFAPGLGAALAGSGEAPAPIHGADADPAIPQLKGYARTLQKLNETKSTRAAT